MIHTRTSGDLALNGDDQVEGRIVPFDVPATVTAPHPDTGDVTRFTEVFRRGSLAAMIQGLTARGWTGAVSLNLDHRSGVPDLIGYATVIEEHDDGAYGTFQLHVDDQLQKIKSMLNSSHRGLSIGFVDKRHRTDPDGVVEWRRIHLDHVAATPTPAHAGAAVTAVRSSDSLDDPTPHVDELRDYLNSLRTR